MSGLVLEGGGMRGVYTAGVLDFFLEKNILFENVYGVSAGAVNGCNFLSGQKGRTLRINVNYMRDKRYASVRSFLTTGDFFGVKMCYDTVPNQLDLYDYEAYRQYQGNFYAVVTNCLTGKAEYKKIKDMKKGLIYVRASSSLPLLSRDVMINGIPYLDGGIADSIPIRRAQKDGNRKNVIILTRDISYQKEKSSLQPLIAARYVKYPNLVKSIQRRHLVYNRTLAYIRSLEKKGKVFVIRPEYPVTIGRLEKDGEKLNALYRQGYEDAKKKYKALMKYLEN